MTAGKAGGLSGYALEEFLFANQAAYCHTSCLQ